VKVEKDFVVSDIIHILYVSTGIHNNDGVVYNPRQFLSVKSITCPETTEKLMAKNLDEVLF
jgi:hypothetical protein